MISAVVARLHHRTIVATDYSGLKLEQWQQQQVTTLRPDDLSPYQIPVFFPTTNVRIYHVEGTESIQEYMRGVY